MAKALLCSKVTLMRDAQVRCLAHINNHMYADFLLHFAGSRNELNFDGSAESIHTNENLLSYVFVDDLSGLDFSYLFKTTDSRYEYLNTYGSISPGACINFHEAVNFASVLRPGQGYRRSLDAPDAPLRMIPHDGVMQPRAVSSNKVMQPLDYDSSTYPMYCLEHNGTLTPGSCHVGSTLDTRDDVAAVEKQADLEGVEYQLGGVCLIATNQRAYPATATVPNLRLNAGEITDLATSLCNDYNLDPNNDHTRTGYFGTISEYGEGYAISFYRGTAASNHGTVPSDLLYNIVYEMIAWVVGVPNAGSGSLDIVNAAGNIVYGTFKVSASEH